MSRKQKEISSLESELHPDAPRSGQISPENGPGTDLAEMPLSRPQWARAKVKAFSHQANEVDKVLREQKLITVCEKADCPNRFECSDRGVATFMILGDKCTRQCHFCAVESGQPEEPDVNEPEKIANAVLLLGLDYVVMTSVTRDDLSDGGARHFAECIRRIRQMSPGTHIEILTPDFQGVKDIALDILGKALPDTMNHNIETVPRLYPKVRSAADYAHSLDLLKDFKKRYPKVRTKSGLMAGLGETDEEILHVMQDLRRAGVDMLTIGQYLQPTRRHLPILRYVHPDIFAHFERQALQMGFTHANCAPLVRSSYMADYFQSAMQ